MPGREREKERERRIVRVCEREAEIKRLRRFEKKEGKERKRQRLRRWRREGEPSAVFVSKSAPTSASCSVIDIGTEKERE